MIDLHTHLLPGIDDGSKSLEETRAIIAGYIELGFTAAVVTPHIRSGMFDNDEDHIRRLTEEIQEDIEQQGVAFKILPGVEYYFDDRAMQRLLDPSQLLSFGDQGKYILLEFNSLSKPVHLRQLVFDLKVAGITPIMAHPERYAFVAEDLDFVEELVDAGMLMQGTLTCLSGMWGNKSRNTLKKLLDRDLLQLISTDNHNAKQIQKYTTPAINRLRDWIGDARIEQLMTVNPQIVFEGGAL